MLDFAFNKYFKNFKEITPYLLVKGIFDLVLLRLMFIDLSVSEMFTITNNQFSAANGGYGSLFGRIIIYFIIVLFTSPIFSCYVRVIMKKVVNEQSINHIEAFKEGLSYYWRYIGVSIIIALMILGICVGILLLTFIPVLGILTLIAGVIFLIYIGTIYTICTEYLIYNDSGVDEALSEGKRIGKGRFWSIFFLGFCINIIGKILEKISEQGIALSIIITFVVLAVDAFSILYLMSLCKEDKSSFLIS